jgi:hypothetical protein
MKYGPLIKRFRIENPKRFNLAHHDPGIAVAHTKRMTDAAAPLR